jgi:hypothetical protein
LEAEKNPPIKNILLVILVRGFQKEFSGSKTVYSWCFRVKIEAVGFLKKIAERDSDKQVL